MDVFIILKNAIWRKYYMRKSILRKVYVAFLTLVVAFSSVMPCGAYAGASVKGNGFGTNVLAATNSIAGKETELLYGGDATEYALGVAAHFALFGKEVSIYPAADCVGRVAADEFYIEALQGYGGENREYGIKAELTSGKSIGGAATIICNNSVQKSFGLRVAPEYSGHTHLFVVSNDVTRFAAAPSVPHNAAKIEKNTYKVARNSLIDFDQEMNNLSSISALFAANCNGKTSCQNGKITLTGTDSKVNYFNVDGSALNGIYDFTMNVPYGSFVIINVSGKDVTFPETLSWAIHYANSTAQVGDMDTNNRYFLFNFYEAEKVTLVGPSRGNILAPNAIVSDAGAGYHNAGQIVAKKINVKHEQGAFGFLMPKTYMPAEAYTVHYVYYDATGALKELPSSLYSAFIGKAAAPEAGKDNISNAYKTGNQIQAVNSNKESSVLSGLSAKDDMKLFLNQYANDCEIRFAVYEDGKTWNQSKKGSDLTNPETYASMERKADIAWDETYQFGSSNVYFVMYPTAKVKVDVSFDDKHNKSGKRPEDLQVTLVENVPNASSSTVIGRKDNKDSQNVLSDASTVEKLFDEELQKEVEYDVFRNAYEYSVPLFGMQMNTNGQNSGRIYGATVDKFGADGLFDIQYEVPEEYKDVTVTRVNKEAGELVDKDGYVAVFHIVLRGEYKAQFFLVDEDGNRTEVFKENFFGDDDYEKFRGLSDTDPLPSLTGDELADTFGDDLNRREYTVTWKDVSTGKFYTTGDKKSIYSFDYEDVVFEATLRRNETVKNHPWLYTYIINFRGSNFIPGSVLWQRLEMDGDTDPSTGGYTFIQKDYRTSYSYESLKARQYDNETFFMLSFAFGVDTDRAKATRVTVSDNGFGSDSNIIYEATMMDAVENTLGLSQTFQPMNNVKPMTLLQMIPEDYYIDDYDGMRYFKLVLPTDKYEGGDLYFTVYYYDEDGRESVWFNYSLNLETNAMWSIVKNTTTETQTTTTTTTTTTTDTTKAITK